MRWSHALAVPLLTASLVSPVSGQSATPAGPWEASPTLSVGGFLGYQRGLAIQLTGTLRDFAEGLPFQARVRIGRTAVEPGSAADARKIFINDATNGSPRESGHTWDFGLEALHPIGITTQVFGGIRHSRFKANFKYVGGNEDFDITSSHWGIAAGVESTYAMSRRLSLLFSGGLELFLSSRLTGHDTSYSPDGDHVNPRLDYTYSDADDAIGQPTWRPVAVVGVTYKLGR
jgi:hypothetical protein